MLKCFCGNLGIELRLESGVLFLSRFLFYYDCFVNFLFYCDCFVNIVNVYRFGFWNWVNFNFFEKLLIMLGKIILYFVKFYEFLLNFIFFLIITVIMIFGEKDGLYISKLFFWKI